MVKFEEANHFLFRVRFVPVPVPIRENVRTVPALGADFRGFLGGVGVVIPVFAIVRSATLIVFISCCVEGSIYVGPVFRVTL
jgi:uncharacterized membrane protein